MQWLWLVIVAALLVYFVWNKIGGRGIRKITGADLQEKMKAGGQALEIVDVREPSEFKGGHIVKAKNIPLGTLSSKLGEFSKDKEIVFVCRSGTRSMMAAKKAKKAGLNVYNLNGGMSAWHGPVRK
ncbi:MAG: rhodanese-like domain-containing protein [Alicyclobacillaceae bacterium]|jgi:rhodanese-related sulfurtransferase|uniref:rhodanese-like domain-containing protein n=1 Tax=Alicyclobacillus sp. SP_1 TaxID=2942475 RepID=UPI002157F123|nr:rhodanese-like domain-containing protein [Alicyclobacillus sp. SP_1]MCY0889200.1 rhodanese-like domain-containing protein [Alicyclobacillaceae bacterium]